MNDICSDRASLSTPCAAALWGRFLELSAPLWEALAPCRLTAEQRRVLGGQLFSEAAELVYAVGDGMAFDPALFQDLPLRAADLGEEQDGALDLRFLALGLRALAQLAQDAYLHKQTGAIRRALAVLERLRLERLQPLRTVAEREGTARREAQLWPAQKLHSDRHRRRQHKLRRRRLAARG